MGSTTNLSNVDAAANTADIQLSARAASTLFDLTKVMFYRKSLNGLGVNPIRIGVNGTEMSLLEIVRLPDPDSLVLDPAADLKISETRPKQPNVGRRELGQPVHVLQRKHEPGRGPTHPRDDLERPSEHLNSSVRTSSGVAALEGGGPSDQRRSTAVTQWTSGLS